VRLQQIATNLVGNAVKFAGDKPIAVSVSAEQGKATLSVKDEGIGITPEDKAQLFHRFFRGRGSEAGGFGLGLWIVQQLVSLHDGAVSVESELGKGSTFTVTLPQGNG
jgi:signal transduction histidine kinase